MGNIAIENLGKEIEVLLSEYKVQVDIVAKQESDRTARATAKYIRGIAPIRSGRYKASWSVKRREERLLSASIVYAKKPKYRLTHLLEHGHASRNGGRVKAYPHIIKAETFAKVEFVKRIKKGVERIK